MACWGSGVGQAGNGSTGGGWCAARGINRKPSPLPFYSVRSSRQPRHGRPATPTTGSLKGAAVGTDKPEHHRDDLSGLWSRRLSRRVRIIYTFDDKSIHTFALGGNYDGA
ncbi:type II toxin-antitoxin system YoeB family toxin [Guyparkeria hydrothermalis]|uniref:type II toxin-antitoxin system YoeB family toxin n=1 Tax=Guyparkeria hydrothermalis TaxID=923 RepID=UPI002020EDE7|nr:type II toxin-antitoxin system YoeB family toxin [Guyparkeria hydrothermalis]MCL7744653.1 type II toxin-antitoxin system YoeB family toxin [Guyparkeria hydrothermalis]